MVVKSELEKLDLKYLSIDLGEVVLAKPLSDENAAALKTAFIASGLEILESKKSQLVESIKTAVIKMIHYSDELPAENYSSYLGKLLNHNYTYLANVFAQVEGQTIEHFIISHKIEKVKELIQYNELNVTEIANKLHYSSIAHLSNQFKKVTGMTPSYFKNKSNRRQQLDKM
jgi:AraC-like DNA-binding protein